MTDQQHIYSEIHKLKLWYQEHEPFCIFCTHGVKEFDMCHLIRRSDAVDGLTRIQLQTMKDNVWPGHRDCHDIYDNHPELAVFLPGIGKVIELVGKISPQHQQRLMQSLSPYWPEFKTIESKMSYSGELYLNIFINH